MKDVISFFLLVMILSIKPNGLFGIEQGKRA
jgi:branched-subunit amino acid ABC-type transport system permease component